MRRRYQIGPSAFRLREGPRGWTVIEEWSEMGANDCRDDGLEETVSGPHSTREEADRAALALAAR